jgi:uncharacterized protein (TIGR03067 family)
MKTIAAFALGLGFVVFAGLTAAQEKKGDAPKLEGKYKLVGGKVNGKDIDEEAKKAEYTFTSDKITIKGALTFVMSYKLDPKADPVAIDMDILEGPEGTKGAKAQGIVELKGDILKLAYTMDKDKRPKNFDGKDGNVFELKKQK